MRALFSFAVIAAFPFAAASCGSSSAAPAVTPSGTAGAAGAGNGGGGSAGKAGGGGGAAAVPGVSVSFDVAAALGDPAHVFDFPYPSDLRLTATGAPDMSGFPNPAGVKVVADLLPETKERRGFPVMPVAYFRFSDDVSTHDAESVIAADVASPTLLVDVDASSDERGRLVPTVAQSFAADDYTGDHLLGVAMRPGFVLRPHRTYAFVVLRALGDANGKPLGVPKALATLAAGGTPEGPHGAELAKLYAPLWETLKTKGVDAAQVAAATVFTTGDVVADLFELSSKIVASRKITIENLHVDPDDGAKHPRFCELVGTVTYPQFQRGTPPFDTEGTFAIGADGLPIEQRQEVAPITITLPKAAMPAGGYPLVTYFHGSGGLSSAIVDRGTWHVESDPTKCPIVPAQLSALDVWGTTKGCNTKGEGPAHVVAPFGIAMAASALPVNPERLMTSDELAYLNLNNLQALRDVFRQGVIEQRLFIEALRTLSIPPSAVAACSGLSLPAGATAYSFAEGSLFAQGQSMGGMYTNLVGAVEPRIKAVVPTGAGMTYSYFVAKSHLFGGLAGKVAVVLATPKTKLTFLHPTLHVLETAAETIDPIVFAARLARDPLAMHPARSIYAPAGKDDSYFPPEIYDAFALAYGHGEAGSQVWTSMQDALKLDGRDGILPYPVTANRTSLNGATYTGAIVQYAGDGVYDPHAIYSQLDAVKYQYGCFYASLLATGKATIAAPQALGMPCPM